MTANDWAFIEHVTDYMLRPRMGDARHPTLWPSEASAVVINEDGEEEVAGRCRRATFFRYMDHNYKFYDKYSLYGPLVEEVKTKKLPPDRYMLWIWRAGELYEEYLVELAKSSGVYIGSQTAVYMKEWNVSGKIDLVVINPQTHKYSNVEVKSVYGFGGNATLGTPGERGKGKLGTPKDSNLMQIALYDWWNSSHDDAYEDSRLVYGGRDTGRYAEFAISTRKNKDGVVEIFYRGKAPNITKEEKSPITINSILEQYQYIQTSLDGGNIPERDFELKYSDTKLDKLYEKDGLNKTEKERYEKRKAYLAGESKRSIKPIIKGDWQCNLCSFKDICYKSTDIRQDNYGEPRTL